MRKFLFVAGLAGLFMGWNAPNHYPPWTTFHLELFAAAGLCLLFLAVCIPPPAALTIRSRVDGMAAPVATRLPLPRSAQVWLLVALLPVMQFAAGGLVFRGDALVGMLYGLGVVFGLYVGALWAAQQGSEGVVRALSLTIVVGALAAGGVALGQWLRLATPGWWAMELIDDRPFASFAQPNHFGLLMVLAIVAVTALFEMGAIRHRWVHALAVTFFGVGVQISQSRSSALALAVVVGVWLLSRRRAPTRLRLADIVIAVAAWFVLGTALGALQDLLLLKASALRAAAELGPRQEIWLHFWAAIMERPWFGYGFNQGVLALAEVAGKVQPSRNVIFAHDFVLDLMAWFGIPLALAMTVALGVWLARWLRSAATPEVTAQRHWVLAIWSALIVQSLVEFPYTHTYFLLPAALFAGAVTPPPRLRTAPGLAGSPYRGNRSVMVLGGVAAVLLAILAWEYFRVEDDFRFNRFERANFSSRPAHEHMRRAWVLDQLQALNDSAHYDIVPGMPVQQLARLHVLARRFHILSTRLDYAKALALNGRVADAQTEMQIIRSVFHPAQFRSIEREWEGWLRANAAAVSLAEAAGS